MGGGLTMGVNNGSRGGWEWVSELNEAGWQSVEV